MTSPSASRMRKNSGRANSDLDHAIHLTRSLSSNLYPQVLSLPKVQGFIEWIAADAMNSYGLDVKIRVDSRLELASQELRMFIFDSIRELLLNASKHSKTNKAKVQVGLVANGSIKIQVKDSGVGSIRKNKQGTNCHNGLFRIQERADSLGGGFEMIHQPGKGTCAILILPCGK